MKTILISGKAQHGKDTLALLMKEHYNKINPSYRVKITHLGDSLKYACKEFGHWDGKKDERGRSILQHYGTEVVRKDDATYWAKWLKNMLKWFENEWDVVIVPDVRFKNEIDTLQNSDTLLIRIIRPNFDNGLTLAQQQHISETELDTYPDWDIIVNNNKTITDLSHKIKDIVDYIEFREGDTNGAE